MKPLSRPLTTLSASTTIYYNQSPEALTEATLDQGEGSLTADGVLVIKTGRFTGRSPKDRYIVQDDVTTAIIDWGEVNQPLALDTFTQLKAGLLEYLGGREVYVQDGFACSDPRYRLDVRVVAEKPWSALFARNMFNRVAIGDLASVQQDWTVYCAPGYHAPESIKGLRASNFAVISMSTKEIIIGGTGYTGEIKKGIFSVLNFLLPTNYGVLPMHCSANVGDAGDTAIFFGLSGTGKTTLSTDPDRQLVGDDEHGWSDQGVFNFEGGCYAKCIDLSEAKEPEIFGAIKPGAILENIVLDQSGNPDYTDTSITQNTRVSYPIHHIDNIRTPSMGGVPKNIFFLTCDAFGVLPPIAKLSTEQAMYHFVSGYTAKVAGTEDGITEPLATFSACFGAPFMPLHPARYAEMLGEMVEKHGTKIWLVNTGWTGGPYGTGTRMKLEYTRAMINAALKGQLDAVQYVKTEIFGLEIPSFCPKVPVQLLNPMLTWENPGNYMEVAAHLADLFNENFEPFAAGASTEIKKAAPQALQAV